MHHLHSLVLDLAVEGDKLLEAQLTVAIDVVSSDEFGRLTRRKGELFLEYLVRFFGRNGSTAVAVILRELTTNFGRSIIYK